MALRKSIFWVHLVAGLAVGLIVAVMSATGIVIAFEREILDSIDRDVKTVAVPANSAARLTLEQLDKFVATQFPEFKTTMRIVPRERDQAYEYRAGRDKTLFVNPYTGMAVAPKSKATHDALHVFVELHRWLGMEGKGRETGKLITGIATLGFLFLCISGLYMWWPRSRSPKAWRPAVWFVGRIKGRARDFNWHNVFGSWSALVLIVIVTSGAVMSFGWANRLVFMLAGEEAPQRGAQTAPPVNVPVPTEGQQRMPRDAVLDRVAQQYPQWATITFDTNQNANDASAKELGAIRPLNIVVLNPDVFQYRGRVQLSVDPYRGDVLSKVAFEDRTPGMRARTWLRFLHTGEAFGMVGKGIATLACIAALFLIYTGLALSYRRFFPSRSKVSPISAETATESVGLFPPSADAK